MKVNDRMKKPVIIKEGINYYSLQVLNYNSLLNCHIRKAQNVTLHNIEDFQEFGIFRNKKGERIRYYVSESSIEDFNKEVIKYKCKFNKKEF
jgi:hypothetical protein